MSDAETIIARIERAPRIQRPDGSLSGYILEVDEWREIREQLRTLKPQHMIFATPCWCGADHWDPGQ